MTKTIEKIINEAKNNTRNIVSAVGMGKRYSKALWTLREQKKAEHLQDGCWLINIKKV